MTGGSAGPAIGSLHSVQHVCSQCVCAACVQRLHCALGWKCKDCGIWFGSSIFLRVLAIGPGLDRSGPGLNAKMP